ncbi:Mss4-like protein [Colletotrichum godetiae]|uniref:Mss4-like protein n=1 Tax=Colletotrichum godetiae TaxID=1209918 RepID=A0AAJ0AN39_9PEZI|nr:Mss4-like protein [Colletotrichum godetiae]KAK1676931.1 Mss4-like protein [Colletotrichum godetiae]
MSTSLRGSCLCGGIQMQTSSGPLTVFSCFCNHCSQGAGGSHQTIAKFETQSVHVVSGSELIANFTLADTSSGSPKEKSFCRTCGTPLWTTPASAKGRYVLIRTSLLESGTELRPESEIFVKFRPPWQHAVDGAVQWEQMRK